MTVVELPVPPNDPRPAGNAKVAATRTDSPEWVRYAAGGALLAGGLLLVTGKPKAGLVAAATGAALAMIDQQDTVNAWWLALPGMIDNASRMLRQVEGVIENVDTQRARIRALVKK
jgi:hypothetical protein